VEGVFEAFKKGFFKVCDIDVVEFFQPEELQAVMVGQENYDWEVFKKVCWSSDIQNNVLSYVWGYIIWNKNILEKYGEQDDPFFRYLFKWLFQLKVTLCNMHFFTSFTQTYTYILYVSPVCKDTQKVSAIKNSNVLLIHIFKILSKKEQIRFEIPFYNRQLVGNTDQWK